MPETYHILPNIQVLIAYPAVTLTKQQPGIRMICCTFQYSYDGGRVAMLLHQKKLYAPNEDKEGAYNLFLEAGVIITYVPKLVAGQQTCSRCSDGFRPHMREEIERSCRENGGATSFFHSLQGNGDAMRFALNSPLSVGYSRYNDPDVLGRLKTNEVLESLRIAASVGVVVTQHRLVHHWPCKAATMRNLSLFHSLDLVIKGKLRLKQQIKNLRVAIDFFADWGPEDCTINLVKKEAYVSLLRTDPRFTREFEAWCAYMEKVAKLPILYELT